MFKSHVRLGKRRRVILKKQIPPNISYLVGIDEVGRGALAGPVTVAAVLLPRHFRFPISNFQAKLKDSKQLTPKQRQMWFQYIKEQPRIIYAIARISPKIIDRINISRAANLAATRVFLKLAASQRGLGIRSKVFLDGGLYLCVNPLLSSKNPPISASTVIRGDEKINAIKLASIVAKVKRDQYMKKLHYRYPQYGFDKHKGYGTKEHLEAVKKHGPSEAHRLTFLRKYITMKI